MAHIFSCLRPCNSSQLELFFFLFLFASKHTLFIEQNSWGYNLDQGDLEATNGSLYLTTDMFSEAERLGIHEQ